MKKHLLFSCVIISFVSHPSTSNILSSSYQVDPHQDASRYPPNPPCSTYSCAESIKRPLVTVRYTLWTHGRLTLSTSFAPPQQYTLKSTLSQHARRKPLGASCQQMSECSEHLRLSSTLKKYIEHFQGAHKSKY